jgi:GntR family carbon starvation induced transcriptional regulator
MAACDSPGRTKRPTIDTIWYKIADRGNQQKKPKGVKVFMLSMPQTMEPDAGPRSQTSWTYGEIRRDILAGRYEPGKKLKIADLAQKLKVSPGAVREALSRLVPEQLVVSRDQRGFAVAPLSIVDLEDLTDLRCEIEAIALRRSAERGDVNWEGAVLAAVHRLRLTPHRIEGDELALNPQWIARHADYHAALVSACESPKLLALHGQLYEQSERYRGLSANLPTTRDVAAEHDAIVELALARDTDRLIELALDHMRATTRLIVAAARKEHQTDVADSV